MVSRIPNARRPPCCTPQSRGPLRRAGWPSLGDFALRSLLFGATLTLAATTLIAKNPATVSFNRDIRPILSEACWHCHGPAKQAAGVRLDGRATAIAVADSEVAPIVPGAPEESELIARIFSADESLRMPPPESHKSLTAAQKELLRRWIKEGAEYETHWAYKPIVRPQPAVESANPIDVFVEANFKPAGLTWNHEAETPALLRRLKLDLTGLPPTLTEIESLTSGAETYEQLVERLLDSPRFAERQAQYWLDAVRFADTRGFHSDEEYPIWPYRDYVLRAFDANKPFDDFAREQLAGDLLPNPSKEQKLASAYNRLGRTSLEGGIQPKEYLAIYGADRVRTLGAVWLGQTIGCAECHDHKFDPITQHDFYALKACFADLEFPGATGGDLELPTAKQTAKLQALDAQLEAAKQKLNATAESFAGERATFEQSVLADSKQDRLAWVVPVPDSASATEGVQLTIFAAEQISSDLMFEGSLYSRQWPGHGMIEASGPNPDHAAYEVRLRPGEGTWTQLGLEVFPDDHLPGNMFARGGETIALSELEIARVNSNIGREQSVALAAAVDDANTSADSETAAASSPLAAIDGSAETYWSVPTWLPIAGSRMLAVRFARPVHTEGNEELVVRLRHDSPMRRATIGRFRLALAADERSWPTSTPMRTLVGPQVAEPHAGSPPPRMLSGLPDDLRAALAEPEAKRSKETRQLVASWFLSTHPRTREAWRTHAALVAQRGRVAANVARCLVSSPAKPEVTRLLPRGNWRDDSGAIVEPAIPGYLGQLSTTGRATRLDLANWLVSPANPLTARVIVNRVWAQHFGVGLCRTADDFGSQGATPDNPELLDWLASEFREPSWNADHTHLWDYKHLVRVIVTSRTYRQSSTHAAEASTLDPENRYLARQNSYRLDAEAIRDQALAAGGMLRHRFGGASVRPYQADGYLATLYFPRRDYPTSTGVDLWRRSVYTFRQRTFPHPTLSVFDACTREDAQVNRVTSNTPLQALVLLNDPVYVEAARALAQQVLAESTELKTQVRLAFRKVLARELDSNELEMLMKLHHQAREEFATNGVPNQFLAIGDLPNSPSTDAQQLAALAATTRAILNLHETITRP